MFVFADQLRAQSVGCYGEPQVRTPHLDRLASEGVRLTHAIAPYPVCSPYRASLLTGNHVFRNGEYLNDVRLPEHNLCAGTIYAEAGYHTGYIGKWHLDGQNRLGFTPPGWRRRGFDYWAVCNCSHDYFGAFYYTDSPTPITIEGWEPDHQTDLAIGYLREHQDDPFCLFVSYGPPHNPFIAPERWMAEYEVGAIGLRANVEGDPRSDIAGYYAATSSLDECVGRILASLDELGLSESTLVVFTSDHGDMLGSQGHERKQRPWDESILVPFIARGPGLPRGRVSDVLFSVVDVLPTVLTLTGVDNPAGMDGRDLSFALRGEEGAEPQSAYIMDVCAAGEALRYGIPEWRGVRTKRYTYARTRDEGWLLYDNLEDPYQLRNLVADGDYRQLRRDLEEETFRHQERLADEFAPGSHYLALAQRAGPLCAPPGLEGPDPSAQVMEASD